MGRSRCRGLSIKDLLLHGPMWNKIMKCGLMFTCSLLNATIATTVVWCPIVKSSFCVWGIFEFIIIEIIGRLWNIAWKLGDILYPNFQVIIFLEHNGRIRGWGGASAQAPQSKTSSCMVLCEIELWNVGLCTRAPSWMQLLLPLVYDVWLWDSSFVYEVSLNSLPLTSSNVCERLECMEVGRHFLSKYEIVSEELISDTEELPGRELFTSRKMPDLFVTKSIEDFRYDESSLNHL